MKISLVTVCYNAAATIRATMESAFAQQGVDLEYLVVDGGSSDGTVAAIEDFAARVRASARPGFEFRWTSGKDRGMYDAINKGFSMSSGDIVGILNADDVFADERVLADVAAELGKSDVDAIYGDVRFVRGDNNETVRYYSSRPWRPWMHNFGYMPAHPTVYVLRRAFDRTGGYRLGYDISADFEWMIRALVGRRGEAAPLKSRYVKRCMVSMRLGGKSTGGLKAMWKLNCENVRANRENGYFCFLAMMIPKYAYKILGYVFRGGRRG